MNGGKPNSASFGFTFAANSHAAQFKPAMKESPAIGFRKLTSFDLASANQI